jgi:hypothetical protein
VKFLPVRIGHLAGGRRKTLEQKLFKVIRIARGDRRIEKPVRVIVSFRLENAPRPSTGKCAPLQHR